MDTSTPSQPNSYTTVIIIGVVILILCSISSSGYWMYSSQKEADEKNVFLNNN